MAYEIGTATDYLDLLDRLKEFVTDPTRAIHSAGQGISELDPIPSQEAWDIKRYDVDWDGAGNDEIELILAGPGVSGSDDILVGAQTFRSAGIGKYDWGLGGWTGYDDAYAFHEQPGSKGPDYSDYPVLMLNNNTIPYWFFANGRRICGVAKVGGTSYCGFYLGYYLPYGVPSSFPYPLVVGGSSVYNASVDYSWNNYQNSCYFNGPGYVGNAGGSMLVLNGDWLYFGNRSGLAVANQIHRGHNTWPYVHGTNVGNSGYYAGVIDKNPADEVPLLPIVLFMYDPDDNILGELHGVYACLCDDVVTEDTVTIDGDTYIIFQNNHYNSSIEYYAIKKE